MASWQSVPLATLVDLADALALLLLADPAPRDWTTCPRAEEIRRMAEHLRERGWKLPRSVQEVVLRAARWPS